ncbi:MAG: hypothetical protein Q8R70_04775 [Methanoregula sp.]|nr:hypothetical protein [Methanoregula sp.]
MTDAVITEYAGTRRNDTISRFYQYGSGGVRVLDGRKNIKRVYRFDPASDQMTEHDPARPDRILRRFVFDRMGMLEETFSFKSRPRTFRYEQGCEVIAVREGGEFGQVGKTFTFEQNGIAETGWGRNGEIERVFIFEPGNDTITERKGGWFGDVERTIFFKGINASLFREPEAFLQFLMFTEWSESDREQVIDEQVAKIRGGNAAGAARSPYAYSGERRTSEDSGMAGGRGPAPRTPAMRQDDRLVRASSGRMAESGIEFIPEGGSPGEDIPRVPVPPSRKSSEISFDERWHTGPSDAPRFSAGKSVEIPLEERFGSARSEREPLSKGRSAEISVSERFENARSERETLSKGRSVEIPLEERFGSAHSEREPLSKGRSVEIPLEERFGNARGEREKLSKGASADISLDERFESAHSEREKLSKGKSAEIPYSERRAGRDR